MKKINLLLVIIFLFTFNQVQCQYSLNDGLMIHYPFNGNTEDVSGNNKHGKANNVALTEGRNGNPNSAYYFSGDYDMDNVSSHISFPTESLTNKNYTYTFWVKFLKLPSTNESSVLLSIGNLGADQAITVCRECLGGEGWGMISYPTLSYSSGALPNENSWYHIAGVRYDNGIRYYVNGVYVGGLGTYEIPAYSTPALGILGNRFNFNGPFKGVMDDVRIYNRALSSKEVNSLFNLQDSIITKTSSRSTFENLTISPNPSNGIFQINTINDNEIITDLEVADTKGFSVFSTNNKTPIYHQIDLSFLNKGIYFIKLKSNFNSYHQKIIIK